MKMQRRINNASFSYANISDDNTHGGILVIRAICTNICRHAVSNAALCEGISDSPSYHYEFLAFKCRYNGRFSL